MSDEELAPLKLNLFLHITGRREDGYHLLESLFCFGDAGDRLHYAPGREPLKLVVTGPFAADAPADDSNLVLRAARLLTSDPRGILTLDKQLPVASGLGGGSADAAAALRLLNRVWQCGYDLAALETMALTLGADVPACIRSQPVYVGGIGEQLYPVPAASILPAIIANPRRAVSTPGVFVAYRQRNPGFSASLPGWPNPDLSWRSCGNDLTPDAIGITPDVAALLDALAALPGALSARMSGSGGSCFALFDGCESACEALSVFSSRHPDWWAIRANIKVPA